MSGRRRRMSRGRASGSGRHGPGRRGRPKAEAASPSERVTGGTEISEIGSKMEPICGEGVGTLARNDPLTEREDKEGENRIGR